jgi:hypothetical protein
MSKLNNLAKPSYLKLMLNGKELLSHKEITCSVEGVAKAKTQKALNGTRKLSALRRELTLAEGRAKARINSEINVKINVMIRPDNCIFPDKIEVRKLR